MIQEIHDEILSDLPKYTIRDKLGNVVTDDADIALKTPVVQEGTPINRALIRNIQGDLYTQDRYNIVMPEVLEEKIDLTIWEASSVGGSYFYYDIAYGEGKFVLVGSTPTRYSEDGLTWTQGTSLGNLNRVIYENNMFIASGDEGNTICTSEDGITWELKKKISSDYLGEGITYGNGVYVVAGYDFDVGGLIYVSEDLTNWTKATTPITNNFYDIAYGNGKFVAVGADGAIITSEDALNWTQRTSSYTNRIETVRFVNNKFIAGTISNSLLVSEDGVTWEVKPLGADYGWVYSIYYYEGEYLVGTRSGYILVLNNNFEINSLSKVSTSGGEVGGFAFDGSSRIVACVSDYKVQVAKTLKPAGTYLNLNMPLSSYEMGKIINIEGGRVAQGGENIRTTDIIPKTWTETSSTSCKSSDGIIATSSYGSPVEALDGNTSSSWYGGTAGTSSGWLMLKFPEAKKITKMKVWCRGDIVASLISCEIQGSNDGSSWTTLYTITSQQNALTEVKLSNARYYLYYRLNFVVDAAGSSANSRPQCYEWQVSEWAEPYEFITSFEKPYLNINNLGAKLVNETINYGEKYTLMYNGASWDVVGIKTIIGSFTVAGNSVLQTVNLPFEPDLVICYGEENNYQAVAGGGGSEAGYKHVPRILTKAYKDGNGYGQIVPAGFTYKANQVIQVYYVAIKF